MSFPRELPRAIWRRAVQPPGLPSGDVAWALDDALDAVAALEGSIVAVLQVDTYVVPYGQHEVIHTGRCARYLYQPGERAPEFAQRTRQSAAEFINDGSREDLFVLLFSGQDDADAGEGRVAVRAG